MPPSMPLERERSRLEQRVRLWKLEVALVVEKLLSLGHSYEVRYTLPAVAVKIPTETQTPPRELRDFGFDVNDLMNSHVFQVKEVCASHFAQRFVTCKGGGMWATGICSIAIDDYFVGMDVENFLLCPRKLKSLRKEVANAKASNPGENQSERQSIVMRFVRLEKSVQVDPLHGRSHGRILRTLDEIEVHRQKLAGQYEELIMQDREIAQRLQAAKKLLQYVKIMSFETQRTLMEKDSFKFARRFQLWYASVMKSSPDENDEENALDDEDSDEDEAPMQTPSKQTEAMEIDSTSSNVALDTQHTRRDLQGGEHQRPSQYAFPSRPFVQKQQATRTNRMPVAVSTPIDGPVTPPYHIEMSWLDDFPSADARWLSNAKDTLENLMRTISSSFFESEYPGHPAVAELGCKIGRLLFVQYVQKRGTVENSVLQKEFKRHARMLRSNLKNPENVQLRRDLVDGALSLEKLCEMESEELAPEALRKERQRIRDAYTQSSTIKAPTGKTLLKTKNGFKEVNMGGGSDSEDTEEALPTLATIELGAASVSTPESGNAVWTEEQSAEAPVGSNQQSMARVASPKENNARHVTKTDVGTGNPGQTTKTKSKPRLGKKRVSFASDVPPSGEERGDVKANLNVHPPTEQRQRSASQSTDRKKAAEAAEARAFLLALLGPTYDIVWSLQELMTTLQSSSMSTMSHEFNLAPGVKLYRGIGASGSNTYKAWVRLAHLISQSDGHLASEATIHAIDGLIKSVLDWRRLCVDMVSHLLNKIGLRASTDTRQTRDAALNYLVQKGIAKFSTNVSIQANEDEVPNYAVGVSIGGLWLVWARGPSQTDVRNDAAQSLISFLIDLGSQFEENNTREREVQYGDTIGSRDDTGAQFQESDCVGERGGESMVDYGDQTWTRREEKPVVVSPVNRKRHYPPSSREEEEYTREAVRPRLEYSARSTGPPAEPERKSAERPPETFVQGYTIDRVGTPARPTVGARSEDAEAKAKSEAYQKLLEMIFKNRNEAVKMLTSIKWDPSINSETAWLPPNPLPPKFSVRRVMTNQGNGQFKCELTGLENVVSATGVGVSVTQATNKAIEHLIDALDSMATTWQALLSTYLDRRSQTPTALMAGNETQAKNRDKVSTEEKLVSPLYMYFISVRNKLAISTACLNAKEAKRSANEQFRDILESLLKKEKTGSSSRQSTSSANGRNVQSGRPSFSSARDLPNAAPANQTHRAAAIPDHKSRTVECSDSEDEDDEDDYNNYSDGEYGEEWKASEVSKSLGTASEPDPIAQLVDREMEEPYDTNSESGATDDARFRAAIRSLFTPADDLCSGISNLRASLKFRGAGHNTIVPNVKANISMERLREGTFKVHVDVNGVIAYTVEKRTKSEACDAAIQGVLEKLNKIRSEWAQLLHFLDTKSLMDVNILDSFNSLKLSGIASITTVVETPLPVMMVERGSSSSRSDSGIHCALRVGDFVLCRASRGTEAEARCLVDCKAAKFFSDLIDCGLDPEPFDDDDENMGVDGGSLEQLQGPPPIDWTCLVRIQDPVIATCFYDFPVNAFWCGAPSGVTATEFPVARELSATQRGSVPVETLASELQSNLHESMVAFFRLESAYDQWKFVKQVGRYAEKRRSWSRALVLTVEPACPYNMYLIPPGGSVNSHDKLYWPTSALPRHLQGCRTQVIGFLTTKTIPEETVGGNTESDVNLSIRKHRRR